MGTEKERKRAKNENETKYQRKGTGWERREQQGAVPRRELAFGVVRRVLRDHRRRGGRVRRVPPSEAAVPWHKE